MDTTAFQPILNPPPRLVIVWSAWFDLIAERIAETEWSLSTVRTLRAIEGGHDSNVLTEFLQSRDEQPLPDTVSKFFIERLTALAQSRIAAKPG